MTQTVSLRNSIGLRLLRIVFSCYLVVTVIVTCTQLYLEYVNIEKVTLSELSDVGKSFEDSLAMSIVNFNDEGMAATLVGMKKIAVVAGVKITAIDNSELSSIGQTGFGAVNGKILRHMQINDQSVRMVNINTELGNIVLYEYKRPILFAPFENQSAETVGYQHLYTNRDLVFNRVKSSFVLILVNAIIKTTALWLIFLFFAKRILSRPLNTLINATDALITHKTSDDNVMVEPLLKSANSPNKDELQVLSHSFLKMQNAVWDKIDNLHHLNKLALTLTQMKDKKRLYLHVATLLQQHFGFTWAAVFNNEHQITWSSLSEDERKKISAQTQRDFHCEHLDRTQGNRAITFRYTSNETDPDTIEKLSKAVSVTYLPFPNGGYANELDSMWLFGDLNAEHLDDSGQLNKESNDFLQIIANMTGNVLMNLKQHEIIRHHNEQLEKRVMMRTKELSTANTKLKYLSVHDPLTDLPNRTLFKDRLDFMLKMSERSNQKFAVGSIDLTKFKTINDTYGHDAGDLVLIEVSKRFKKVLRKSDTLARFGGDEFTLILCGDDIQSAIPVLMARFAECLKIPIALDAATEVLMSANIGIAFFPEHATNGDLLYKLADVAMYKAKNANMDYMIYSPAEID